MGAIMGRPKRPETPPPPPPESVSSSECSTTNSNRTDDAEEANEAGWETIEDIWEAACTELESRGWETFAVIAARKAAEEAEASMNKEEDEARAAEDSARKEHEEYLEAQRSMDKERLEAEEAEQHSAEAQRRLKEQDARASLELREAEEAEADFAKEEAEAVAAEEDFERELREAEEAEELAKQMWKLVSEAEKFAIRAMKRVERAILKDEAFADFEKAEQAAIQAKIDAEVQQKKANKERAEAEAAHAVAIRERREADEARVIAEKERREATEHAELLAQERATAKAAAEAALKERLEYEEAKRVMDKEKAEFDAAQLIADKERKEADEARRRRDEQASLLLVSKALARSSDATAIMKIAWQAIPDDHATLEDALNAIRKSTQHAGEPARIWIRAGRHPVAPPPRRHRGDGWGGLHADIDDDADGRDDDADTEECEVDVRVDVMGDEGAVLVGSVNLAASGGGALRNLRIESRSGPGVWATGGEWSLVNCHVSCTGGGHDALLCGGEARLGAEACSFGGAELGGGGEQDMILGTMGLSKRTLKPRTGKGGSVNPRCSVAVQGKGSVELTGCRLWGGTQSAVSIQQSGNLKMTYCEVGGAAIAFSSHLASPAAGLGVFHCTLRTPNIWAGIERPGSVEDSANRVQFFTSRNAGTPIGDGALSLQT